ncbi:MAG: hypothetical protein AB8B82_01355 [Roseovarius sp.]
MIRSGLAAALLILAFGAQAQERSQTVPNCGWAQMFCECGALFAVLDTQEDDPAFVAALREAATSMREQLYMWHGQSAGDRMMAAHITALQDQPEGLQSAIDLAKRLQTCEPYFTRKLSGTKVLISP